MNDWRSRELTFKAWHHGYLGIALILLGMVVIEARWGKTLAILLGLILVIDDAVQHAVQIITDSDFKSPLKRLYSWFYVRIPALQHLNAWLDARFK